MTIDKLKWAAGVLLIAATLAGFGAGRWATETAVAAQGPKPDAPADPVSRPPARPAPPDDAPRPADPLLLPDAPPPALNTPPAETPKAGPFVVAKPVGTWVREIDTQTRIIVTFEEDRLFASATFGDGPDVINVTLDADYSINKESVVYGVVTGIDAGGADDTGYLWREYVGQPFAFGFRADGEFLGVKDVRFAGARRPDGSNQMDGVLGAIQGRYYAGPKDAAKPGKPAKPPAPRPRRNTSPVPPPAIVPGGVVPGLPAPGPAGPTIPPASLPGSPN